MATGSGVVSHNIRSHNQLIHNLRTPNDEFQLFKTMSYQFEDDSALEELLNQQLDRRRQQTLSGRPATSSSNRAAQPFRPASSRVSNIDVQSQPQPDRSLPPQTSQADQSAAPKGKLASWLATPNTATATPTPAAPVVAVPGRDDKLDRSQTTRKSSIASITRPTDAPTARGRDADLGWMCDEVKLQEMSKQRLIQFILEEIQPSIRESMNVAETKLRQEISRLSHELDEEKTKYQLREKQQIELIEAKWQQLNRQLEARLETSESELKQSREGHKSLVRELDDEFKRQMKQVGENYQTRLEEEKKVNEDALRRSEELHRLEMESKLKVNLELDKLDKTFGEWQRMVRVTVSDLGEQLRTIEGLLERQTLEVNTTNVNLTKKSQQLSEQYAKFESQTSQLDQLSAKLSGELLPQFSQAQKESQSAIDKVNLQLEQMQKQTESLDKMKLQLDREQQQLELGKEELRKEKFHCALELSRLDFKEEKLNDLIGKNERIESELTEQRQASRQREAKLETLELNLDSKSKKLREQNYELHLIRKRLAAKENDLAKSELRLRERSSRLDEEETKLRETKRRLEELSNKVKRESSQLSRLQKSLICSLCFGRLFDADLSTQQLHLATPKNLHLNISGNREPLQCPNYNNNNNYNSSFIMQKHNNTANHNHQKDSTELELAALSDYFETDAKELESECKYVEMLPLN